MDNHVSCQNPDLDSELIRLCIRVLEKSDYLGIGLTVLNQLAYSIKIMDIRDGESCSERVKTKVETVL